MSLTCYVLEPSKLPISEGRPAESTSEDRKLAPEASPWSAALCAAQQPKVGMGIAPSLRNIPISSAQTASPWRKMSGAAEMAVHSAAGSCSAALDELSAAAAVLT